MALGGSTFLQNATMLEQLLEEINFQRTKEMRQLMKDDSGFVVLQGTTYWTDLFVRHFLFQEEQSIDCDDLLFFVRKRHVKGSSRYLPKYEGTRAGPQKAITLSQCGTWLVPRYVATRFSTHPPPGRPLRSQTDVEVFRKDSKKLPIGDPEIDWEETVYLNLIVHQFDYTLTLAICTRTSPKELQVLKRHSQKASAEQLGKWQSRTRNDITLIAARLQCGGGADRVPSASSARIRLNEMITRVTSQTGSPSAGRRQALVLEHRTTRYTCTEACRRPYHNLNSRTCLSTKHSD
ncbi:hypothetical protein KGM_216018 [Danaus plexippus plexippus]|uniref:Uncharacterized protein n=1 Tax=Danaus plexippus plexippus TaxID=278856 RepID=A0A212EVP7_DANPL|nr:hypothetical protein KGM_216018 [Danaus plexippus plexippus]